MMFLAKFLICFPFGLAFVFIASLMLFDCFGDRLKRLIKEALIEVYIENKGRY